MLCQRVCCFEFCDITGMDFSEQDFILGTVMRSYSRGLDFLELNRYVQICVRQQS